MAVASQAILAKEKIIFRFTNSLYIEIQVIFYYNSFMGIKYHYVDSPLYKIECTAKICERHFTQIFKKKFANIGVTQGEFCVMDTIVRNPEISQIELARLLLKGRAHITQMLNSLEEKGVISRTNEIKNGRQVRKTSLTENGTKIYNTICDTLDKNFQSMTKFFDSNDEKLISYLEEITEIITEGEKITFN